MIHRGGDGLGPRKVFLNGKPIPEGVVFADTVRGIIVITRYPLKVHKYGKRVLTYKRHGVVRVQFIKDNRNANN